MTTPPAISRTSARAQTLLLVQDDGAARRQSTESLSGAGYTVLAVATGAGAVALATTYPEPIHLLLSDVVLPDMSGPELARRVLCARPLVDVLFMTAQPQYGAPADRRGGGPSVPRDRTTTARAVREALTGTSLQENGQ